MSCEEEVSDGGAIMIAAQCGKGCCKRVKKMFLPTSSSSVLRRAAASARAAIAGGLLLAATAAAAVVPLGDRLVVGINNVPYTQRQVECYILVKESLRKTDTGVSRVIDERSWPQALAVFSEDMSVLQEAERLGSYQNETGIVEKFFDVVKQKRKKGHALDGALKRLGVDDQGLTRTLESVLRVAAFRKAKDKGASDSRVKWLADLVDRSVVRYYRDASKYVLIEPTGPQGG